MGISTLIIDDNKRYTSIIKTRLEEQGCEVEHILSSKASLEHLANIDANHYQLIITDITMETQVSGIQLTYRIRHKINFRGCLVIYSTGFNHPFVLWMSKLFFRFLGADGLIPKNGLLKGRPKLAAISKNPLLKMVSQALKQ